MKSLRLALLLCVLVIAAVAFPAAAQEENTFGLSAEDWALFTGIQTPESSAYEFASQLGMDVGGNTVSWDLTGNGQFGDDLFALILDGSISAEGSDTPLNLELRGVDGSLYISPDGGTNWFGGTQEEIEQLLTGFTSMMGSSLPVNPDDLASGDVSGLMSQPGVMEAVAGLSSLDPSTFITIVRDADVDGNAHFVTSVDIATLISSPELAPLIGSAAAGQMGTTATELTEEQAAQISAMMAQMFAGSTVVLDQYIDPMSGQLQGLNLAVTLNVPTEDGASGAISLTFAFDFTGEAASTVTAPETFAPISEALSGMGAMAGGM